jgi:indolepyruvate ferredoxin oxidoreductase alpha subunit
LATQVLNQQGKRMLLMGNEALARGAIEAGVELASAYPGTPSSEVMEVLWEASKEVGFYAEWSTNEKIAFEVAAGAALTGARSLCVMKNAGLNVAMDTFATLPYTGVRGGFVVIVADDPGAHYSSTEQDTRALAAYAEIPCLEPCDQEEARSMAREAFNLSEQLELPVMIRTVTRLSHASGDVLMGPISSRKSNIGFNKHFKIQYRWNVYGAPGAVSKHRWLHSTLQTAKELAEVSPFNKLQLVSDKAKLGIVTSGLGYAYIHDVLLSLGILDQVNLLKLGLVNPIPENLVRKLVEASGNVLVVEEGDPFLEKWVRTFAGSKGSTVYGKCETDNQVFNMWDELNQDIVTAALQQVVEKADLNQLFDTTKAPQCQYDKAREEAQKLVTPRSSTLCPGCPHLGSYWALKRALRGKDGVHIVNGDIGCYEQGGYGLFGQQIDATNEASKKFPVKTPYEILDTLYVMGSGLGMAQGQSHLPGLGGKVIAVSGDSTFFHANLPSIANAALTKADVTYLVLDNSWTAMTGHQPSPRTGKNQIGKDITVIEIENTIRALGIEQLFKVSAFDLTAAQKTIEQALSYNGPSVVILEGECALQVVRRKEAKPPFTIVEDKCTGCKTCLQLGCSAIGFDVKNKKANIDAASCAGCGLCQAICPTKAITGAIS